MEYLRIDTHMKSLKTILIVILLGMAAGNAQIRVVVADFTNTGNELKLDAWERMVPDLLQAELSRSPEVYMLERRKLDAVFEEQKLAIAGFVEDSALVRQIGHLLGAEVILAGKLFKLGRMYRIDVNIIRVKTTQVITETVTAPDSRHLSAMLDVLTHNILFRLTGNGSYQYEQEIAACPSLYFLSAGAGLALASYFSYTQFRSNQDTYRANTALDRFDTYYNKANNAHKWSVALGWLSAAAFTGSVICWIKNKTDGKVKAIPQLTTDVQPAMSFIPGKEARFGVQISF